MGRNLRDSVFLINKLPYEVIAFDTPYHRLSKKHADLSFIKTTGARAFIHVETHTTKLQLKAWEGRLVGYGADSRTFCIYKPSTKQVLESRNVTFIEPPFTRLPSGIALGDQVLNSGDINNESTPDDNGGNEKYQYGLRSGGPPPELGDQDLNERQRREL